MAPFLRGPRSVLLGSGSLSDIILSQTGHADAVIRGISQAEFHVLKLFIVQRVLMMYQECKRLDSRIMNGCCNAHLLVSFDRLPQHYMVLHVCTQCWQPALQFIKPLQTMVKAYHRIWYYQTRAHQT